MGISFREDGSGLVIQWWAILFRGRVIEYASGHLLVDMALHRLRTHSLCGWDSAAHGQARRSRRGPVRRKGQSISTASRFLALREAGFTRVSRVRADPMRPAAVRAR